MFIYDRSQDRNAAYTKPAVRPAEPRTQETSGLYPQGQVTRLIMETGDNRDQEQEDRRTPVDLQDIVEKLNNAIRDAKSNMNTQDQDLSPVHRAT